ncbi:MAG TPA: Essential recombination function protein [Acinetobacter ursingii]|uniref:Essential recombination function protein n=1 Tax=Acinetobacter ursingii TaxID=108980 RepID=A0A3D2SKX1_9GAMM|nr:Essential recombination function protein [Acinetobacter ursingii]
MNAQVNSINTTNALVEIQHELKAPKDKFNSFGKYHYRSCESILEALKPLLVKYGCTLVLTDESKELCGIPVVIATAKFTDSNGKETVVKAEAGVEVSKKGMDIAQTFGTSSSYARKYALNGLFLIDDSKDADTDEYINQTNNSKSQTVNKRNITAEGFNAACAAVESGQCTADKVIMQYALSPEQIKHIKSLGVA